VAPYTRLQPINTKFVGFGRFTSRGAYAGARLTFCIRLLEDTMKSNRNAVAPAAWA